ncbi:MAG: DNA-binding protein [Candidatus Rehaiarchaeum fermentans]|nr:DNA-binding protein [Candidatus Rehaiarchaeum fermentans]
MNKEDEEQKKLNELKNQLLSKYLTKEARERLSIVKLAHKDLAESVENIIVENALRGRINQPLTEEQLKNLLKSLSSDNEESNNINVKRK